MARGEWSGTPLVHARVLGRSIVWPVDQGLRVPNLCLSPILGDAANEESVLLPGKEWAWVYAADLA